MNKLEHILTYMEFDNEEQKKIVDCAGNTFRKFMASEDEYLRNKLKKYAGPLIKFRAWYYKKETDKTTDLKDAFTVEAWGAWLDRDESSSAPASLDLGHGASYAMPDISKFLMV